MQRIQILLLGAGGTGGEVLYALARMHTMMLALGHPAGLHVTLMDGDHVAEPNLGRQRFFACDLTHNKANVLIHRFNLAFGLDWTAIPRDWSPREDVHLGQFDLLVSCVDRASVRVALARNGANLFHPILWMDFGNGTHTGQCILGHLGESMHDPDVRLPNVLELFPELKTVQDDAQPSCSSAEALRQQDLFTNPLLAEAGVSLLWRLLRTGQLDAHGVLVDLRIPSVTPLMIDTDVWSLFRPVPRRRKMRVKSRPARATRRDPRAAQPRRRA